jgi:hypothetical protein
MAKLDIRKYRLSVHYGPSKLVEAVRRLIGIPKVLGSDLGRRTDSLD